MVKEEEWVLAEHQPTYEPGEPGVTVTAIPVMVKKQPKKLNKPEKGINHVRS